MWNFDESSENSEMIHPTFLDKDVNKYINEMYMTQEEFQGVYVDGKGNKNKFKRRSFAKFDMYFNDSGWVNIRRNWQSGWQSAAPSR